jgi:Tfp pilus assembly protein PilN
MLWWLMLSASTGVACWGTITLYDTYERLRMHEQALVSLRHTLPHRTVPKPSRAQVESERQWSLLRQELAFSWYPVFAALERSSNPKIALLEFTPDKATGRLTLRGTARDMEALTDYLEALTGQPSFHHVYLSHQKKMVQGNVEVASFEIRVQL